MSDLLDQILGGDYFTAICDTCRQAKTFKTERARDLWMNHHAHQEDPA